MDHLGLAIERHRIALLGMLAALYAAVGLTRGGVVATMPRRLRSLVLTVLKPAESALRRLLVIRAQSIEVTPGAKRAAPLGRIQPQAKRVDHVPAFPLFDTRKRFDPPRTRRLAGPGPRIFLFDGLDPPFGPAPPEPMPDDPMDAARLCQRLETLHRALDDLPKQAARLARVLARRRQGAHTPRQVTPMRPGLPPGHRGRARHPVDGVLKECHWLAHQVIFAPKLRDTS